MRLDCGIFAIRNWRREDVPRLSSIADNPNVSRYMTSRFPSPYTLDDARDWIGRNIGDTATDFAIEVDDEVAGGIGYEIALHERSHSAEIGYWLGEAYWRRGIAAAALAARGRKMRIRSGSGDGKRNRKRRPNGGCVPLC